MTNPFGDIDSATITQHEMFQSYIRAGFSRAEALELVKTFLAEIIRSHFEKGTEETNG